MFKSILDALGSGWKTVTGALVWAYGHLEATGLVQVLPPKWGSIVETVGAVLTAFGLYHAVTRGPGQ
jgi:hypothetical protein